MSARKLVPILLIVGLVVLGANVLLRRKVDLLLVNPSSAAVKVSVNGAAYEVPPTGKLLVAGVSPDLQLQAAGVTVPAGAAGDPSTKTWVWSVAPVTSWWTVSKGYGDQIGAEPATTAFVPSSSPVFALPEDYAGLVDAPLPENVSVKTGVTGTLRRALWSDGYADRTAPRHVILAVHNASLDSLRVEADGKLLGTVIPKGVLHVPDQPRGPVKLRAVVFDAQGKETGVVHTAEGDLAAAPPLSSTAVYVWDAAGTSRFWIVSRRYGPDPDAEGPSPPPEELALPAGSTLFALSEDFFTEVDGDFPDTWPRRQILKLLWCDDHFGSRSSRPISPEIQKQLEAVIAKPRPAEPLGPDAPPDREESPFGPVPPDREGD